MKKDSVFWLCIIINMIALMLLVIVKPLVHLLPAIAMHIIIKLNLTLQLLLGFYGLWVSTDPKIFSLFSKIFGILVLAYILLKLPALNYLNQYYTIERDLFSPFPFVLGWIVNKAFYQITTKENQV